MVPTDGLDEVDYMTSQNALYRREQPDSLVILGGSYITVEPGYFFESVGTEVTIVESMEALVPREDSDIAETFTDIARERHEIYTGHRATAVDDQFGNTFLPRRQHTRQRRSSTSHTTPRIATYDVDPISTVVSL